MKSRFLNFFRTLGYIFSAGMSTIEADVLSKKYWGPRIWRLLHTMSCHPSVGSSRPSVLERDERSAWLYALRALGQIMPCDRCKKHYMEWFMVTNMSKQLLTYGDLRTYIRSALFDLHCSANLDQGLPPTPVVYTELDTAYPPKSLTPIVQDLEKTWARGLELRTIPLDGVKLWKKSLSTLLGLYGLF